MTRDISNFFLKKLSTKIILLPVFILSPTGVAFAAYTRQRGQSGLDAAISSFVGHLGIGIILLVGIVIYNFFKKK